MKLTYHEKAAAVYIAYSLFRSGAQSYLVKFRKLSVAENYFKAVVLRKLDDKIGCLVVFVCLEIATYVFLFKFTWRSASVLRCCCCLFCCRDSGLRPLCIFQAFVELTRA